MRLFDADEKQTISERRMSFQVGISYFATVVEGKHHLAPNVIQAGPPSAGDGLSQRLEVSSHIVRFQNLVGTEDGEDLFVDCIELRRRRQAAACTRLRLSPA